MKINIKATNLTVTPALDKYIQAKVSSLSNYLQKWEQEGVVEAWVEVARTTQHHKKGDVFLAEIHLKLPGEILRVVENEWDVRVAIDRAKNTLREEIKKYKDTHAS